MPLHFTVVMQNVEVVFHTVVKLDSGLILPVVVASAILWLLFEIKQTLHNYRLLNVNTILRGLILLPSEYLLLFFRQISEI